MQDKRGFIWIGTDDGLNRYDGNHFLTFRNSPGSSVGISGNIITGLLEDKNEIIWIASADGGLNKYDYRQQAEKQFKQYKNKPSDPASIPVNIINAIVQDENDFLWLATSGKRVIRFNKRTEKFENIVDKGTTTAMALCIDQQKNLWVGRQGGGLLKINTQSLKYEFDERYTNLYAKLPHAVITSLFKDSENNMWYGSWDKVLYRFNMALQKEETFQQSSIPFSFSNDEITDFAEDRHGSIWMAGNTSGLHAFDKNNSRFYNYRFNPAQEGTICDNTVNCVFIDKNDNLWVGTNKGLSISSLQQQFIQQFLPAASANGQAVTIYDFFLDKNKSLWIASSNGIYIKKNTDPQLQHRPVTFNNEKIAVTKFYKDVDGALYFGSNYSLFRYDSVKRNIEPLPDKQEDKVMNRIIASRVVSVIRDTINNNPVLLTSAYGHYLAYYDLKEKMWVSRLDSNIKIVSAFNLSDNLIRKFYRSSDGRIWLAMAKEGLGLLEKRPLPRVKYFKNDPSDIFSITNNNVFDITDDGKGSLWITTSGGGLSHFNTVTNKFRHINSSANLLEGVQTDANGNVWMIAGGNLHRYNPITDNYSSFELPDIEKSGGINGYIYKDNDGLLYAAGTNYFFSFKTDEIKENVANPKVLFTDFKVFNKSFSHLLFQKKIKLNYNQNFFTIEFASPHYYESEKIHYSYMLEGIDNDWVDVDTRNIASYPNTGSGSFVFKVRASVGNGKWTETVSSLHIEVIAPFWKRWWFYTLCALGFSATIYFIYHYRVNELLKRQAIRNKIAQDLHDSVGSTLSSISVYSQVAQIQSKADNKAALTDVLGKISNTSSDMISELNDIVWAINPRNDSMEKITQRMESFAKPLAVAKNIHFNLSYDKSILSLQLDMDKRKNFYLIFKEAVTNAIKYSAATNLNANIIKKENHFELIVKDNGVGFNMNMVINESSQSLSGNGLRNMQARAQALNGNIIMASDPGNGTTITLQLPLS